MKIDILHAFKPPQRSFGGDLTVNSWYEKGLEQGLDLNWVTNRDAYETDADVVLVSDLNGFAPGVLRYLEETPKPLVFVANASLPPAVSFLHRLAGIVFIAPDQHTVYHGHYRAGFELVAPCYVDHARFVDLGLPRIESQAYIGEIAAHKIGPTMITEIAANPETHYFFYGSTANQPDYADMLAGLHNVVICAELKTPEAVNFALNRHTTFFWKLDRYGSFGRTNVEALLAGCELNVNTENFGLFKFDVDFTSREAITTWLDESREAFWPRLMAALG